MKISSETLNLLKSFTSINPSIYVNKGNSIRTISPQKTVLAQAELDDKFKKPFGIYDLNQFLSAVSLFEEPEFEFNDNDVEIKNGASSLTYRFADKNMIMQPPEKEITLPDVVVEFSLTEQVLRKSLQAASTLGLPNWSVVGDGSKIYIVVSDMKNESGNQFRYEVGETDQVFDLSFKTENLKFIPTEYNVKISSKGISHFVTNDAKVQYWIATESR